jgi:hypothetical protein
MGPCVRRDDVTRERCSRADCLLDRTGISG